MLTQIQYTDITQFIDACFFLIFKSKMVTAEGWMVTAGEWSSSQIVTILTWSVRMKPQIIEGLVFLCVLVQIALNRGKKILYRAYFSELVASKRLTVLDSLNQKRLRKQTFGCRIRFVSKRWFIFFIDIRVFLKQIEIEMKIQVNTSLLWYFFTASLQHLFIAFLIYFVLK